MPRAMQTNNKDKIVFTSFKVPKKDANNNIIDDEYINPSQNKRRPIQKVKLPTPIANRGVKLEFLSTAPPTTLEMLNKLQAEISEIKSDVMKISKYLHTEHQEWASAVQSSLFTMNDTLNSVYSATRRHKQRNQDSYLEYPPQEIISSPEPSSADEDDATFIDDLIENPDFLISSDDSEEGQNPFSSPLRKEKVVTPTKLDPDDDPELYDIVKECDLSMDMVGQVLKLSSGAFARYFAGVPKSLVPRVLKHDELLEIIDARKIISSIESIGDDNSWMLEMTEEQLASMGFV